MAMPFMVTNARRIGSSKANSVRIGKMGEHQANRIPRMLGPETGHGTPRDARVRWSESTPTGHSSSGGLRSGQPGRPCNRRLGRHAAGGPDPM
ncbi:hypothetical protein GCM10020216_070840 [Nonomuraea helvata]